jgi:hypothetical protein
MIDPVIRKALESARDKSDHRSVTIRRDHLAHILGSDIRDAREIDTLLFVLDSADQKLKFEIDYASPFPKLGPWAWPLLVGIAALSGWL